MQEFTTCLFLWCKRLFKKPLFLFTLLLLPACVLFLQHCHSKTDAVIRVALYSPDTTNDNTAARLINDLKSLSNTAVTFYECSTPKELRQDVAEDNAACGYLFPKNLEQKLEEYAVSKTPYITAVRLQDDVRTKIVDEIVLSRLYHPVSYHILTTFLEKQTGKAADDDWLTKTYQKHSSDELLFQFEYANGDTNTLLNDANTNYMLMPIRGIVSVMVLLSCMAGSILWYSDANNALFLMNPRKMRLCSLLSLLLPAIFAAFIGLITIKMTGISEHLLTELPAMLLFLCSCLSLVHLLRTIFQTKELFLAAMPVMTIGSLILCPVFISLQSIVPALSFVSKLFPTTWYLAAIHDSQALLSLLVYSFCLFLAAFLYSRIRRKLIFNLQQL